MMFFVQAAEESEAEEARARLQVCEKIQTLNSRVGERFSMRCVFRRSGLLVPGCRRRTCSEKCETSSTDSFSSHTFLLEAKKY